MKLNFNGRRARLFGGLAVTAALFVPLTVFGGSALARSTAAAAEYQYSGSSQYQYRVQICHLTGSKKHPFHTITVSSKAVAAHVRHGDHAGPCTGTETVKPKHHSGSGSANGSSSSPTTPGSNGKGHGKGHGK
jgi:hypothetical protein